MAADVLSARVQLRRDGPNPLTLALDVQVAPGVTVLFGPSGAGKSTVLALIAGLLRPDAGTVRLGATVWSDSTLGVWVPTHQRRVALVFQAPLLFPHLSVLSNVVFGVAHNLPRADREEQARSILEQVRAGHLAHRRPRSLSGGEAQRVALARSLAGSPRLVLLDEAFSALHQSMREELLSFVRDYGRSAELPLIYVTHNAAEARAVADRVIVLEEGQVVGIGGVELLP